MRCSSPLCGRGLRLLVAHKVILNALAQQPGASERWALHNGLGQMAAEMNGDGSSGGEHCALFECLNSGVEALWLVAGQLSVLVSGQLTVR